MKKFSIKAVALAAGILAGGSVFAAVDLDDSDAPGTVKIASQSVISSSGTALTDAAAYNATATLGSAIPVSTTRYIRMTLSSGTFTANPALTVSTTNATVSLLQGGTGEAYALFSVVTSSTDAATSSDTVTFNPAGITVKSQAAVSLTYGLYETQSAAQNQTLPLKTASQPYLAFASGLVTTVTANTKTADVDASPSFTKFTSSASTVALAEVYVNHKGYIAADATTATAGTMVDTAVLVLNGDFTAAANDAGTYTGDALDRVFVSNLDDCSTTLVSASALTATKATFSSITGTQISADADKKLYVCLTAEGTPEIPVADYTLDIDYTASGSDYSVADLSAIAAGSVVRNGVTLVAPLVNQPTGWYSRLALSNTGSVARPYTITAVTESGSTINLTGEAASGTVAASSTKVINLDTLATITGGLPRGSLKVVVNGPDSAISGVYQIANGTTGMISNYTLVKK